MVAELIIYRLQRLEFRGDDVNKKMTDIYL